jgi:hypothetical protein
MSVAIVLFLLVFSGRTARAQDPSPGEVQLPLKDYLSLVERAEAAQKQEAQRLRNQETPLAEVVSQSTVARVDGDAADVTTDLEVLIQGRPAPVLRLPLAGFPASIEVRKDGKLVEGAAATSVPGVDGGVQLIAPEPGRYTLKVIGRAPLDNEGGIERLSFPPAAAPVAVTELDLPADVAWSSPGSVVVEEKEQGGRRTVRLAARRGEAQAVELRRKVAGGEADKLLAQAVVLTIFQLRPEGARRHDVVLYEVTRGGLETLTVAVPPGIEVERAATDEGEVAPVIEGGHLTVSRQRRLQGTGYLVLTSTPSAETLAGKTVLSEMKPEVEVRARYLAFASSVAAEARALPEAGWSRVDLTDLPAMLGEALQTVDLVAAWRLTGDGAVARLEVPAIPAAAELDGVVRLRETTTLLTVDGTLLHRDLFTLVPSRSSAGVAPALELTLPAGAKLWSAQVGDQPVRPLERNGKVAVPLAFAGGAETTVEVVSVLEKAIPAGRSELAMELPQVTIPVLDHRWRLLLPEGARYRFHAGDLRPAVECGAVEVRYQPSPEMDKIAANRAASPTGLGGHGELRGQVVDDQGSALPGVTVKLLSPMATGGILQVTDSQGSFRFGGLPAGTYGIHAELEGFSSVDYPNLRISEGSSPTLQLTLTSAVEDVITVTAEAPLLDERRITTGATIDLHGDEGGGGLNVGGNLAAKKKDRKRSREDEERQRNARYAQEVQNLKQGLVGGVRPLPVSIPEEGKALLLTGVLPPTKVSLELEVKGKK